MLAGWLVRGNGLDQKCVWVDCSGIVCVRVCVCVINYAGSHS